MASERPKTLKGDALEQYNLLLEEQVFPFEEQAIQIHELNVGARQRGRLRRVGAQELSGARGAETRPLRQDGIEPGCRHRTRIRQHCALARDRCGACDIVRAACLGAASIGARAAARRTQPRRRSDAVRPTPRRRRRSSGASSSGAAPQHRRRLPTAAAPRRARARRVRASRSAAPRASPISIAPSACMRSGNAARGRARIQAARGRLSAARGPADQSRPAAT